VSVKNEDYSPLEATPRNEVLEKTNGDRACRQAAQLARANADADLVPVA
jgi:hypothetical protein